MTKKKKWLLGLLLLWLVWVSTYFLIRVDLNGSASVKVKMGKVYEEAGAFAAFLGQPLEVKVKGSVDTSKSGTYQITYQARNFLGISKKSKRTIQVVDGSKPLLKLKGNRYITLTIGEPFQDPGYHAEDNLDGDLTSKVKVNGSVDTKQKGTYTITYSVTDSSSNTTTTKRVVEVRDKLLSYQARYDQLDNQKNGWWSDNKLDHKRPLGGADQNKLKEYDTYFLGPDEKTIYLTFDEGSNDTYLNEIADVLAKNDVEATFFLCGNYMKTHADQVKKWVEQGHSIGNHTYHHRSMPDYATKEGFAEFQKEITSMEELYEQITGKQMDKVYRDPKGEWSYRGLAILKDMGYRSYLWSADYLDYDQVYTKEYALDKMMQRYHNGAIYLLHPKQKGNYEAVESFIQNMKKLGYQFGLVRDISS